MYVYIVLYKELKHLGESETFIVQFKNLNFLTMYNLVHGSILDTVLSVIILKKLYFMVVIHQLSSHCKLY